jgi:hypothetical protein
MGNNVHSVRTSQQTQKEEDKNSMQCEDIGKGFTDTDTGQHRHEH